MATAVVSVPTLLSLAQIKPQEPPPVTQDVFAGYPELKKICGCESGLTQFNKDGTVLRGKINPQDVGICQVNLYYHAETANKLKLDLLTLEGNVAYSKHLFDTQGTKPWSWSRSCHGY